MFIAGLFKIALNGKLPICPPTAEWIQCGYQQWDTVIYSDENNIQLHPTMQMNLTNGGERNNAYRKEHTL